MLSLSKQHTLESDEEGLSQNLLWQWDLHWSKRYLYFQVLSRHVLEWNEQKLWVEYDLCERCSPRLEQYNSQMLSLS